LFADETRSAATLGLSSNVGQTLDWPADSTVRESNRRQRPVKKSPPAFGEWPSAPITLLVAPQGNLSFNYQFMKRSLDLLGAVELVVMLSPILLTVLIVLTVTTRGKPLFSQERVGLCGRRFRMWKFRTMRLDADKFQHLVENDKDGPIFKNRRDPRIT